MTACSDTIEGKLDCEERPGCRWNMLDMAYSTYALSDKTKNLVRSPTAPLGSCASFYLEIENLTPHADTLALVFKVHRPGIIHCVLHHA